MFRRGISSTLCVLFVCSLVHLDFAVAQQLTPSETHFSVLKKKKKSKKSKGAKARNVVAVTETARAVLERARGQFTEYHSKYSDIRKNKKSLQNIGQSLEQQRDLAEQTHQQNIEDLNEAFFEKYGIETFQVVIPEIVNLHAHLVTFGDQYRQQVGLPVDNPDPLIDEIVGHFQDVRSSMAKIISSQVSDLRRVQTILQQSSQFLTQISIELHKLALGQNQHLVQYGWDHYLDGVLERFDAERKSLEAQGPVFLGEEIDGGIRVPEFPCALTPVTLPSSLWEYSEMGFAEFLAADFRDWRDIVQERIQDYSRNPGIITSWRGCYQSKLLQAHDVETDINLELDRGNTELARQLDLIRRSLENQARIILSEADSIVHRRDQMNKIINSAGFHGTPQDEEDYPNAWRATVQAHVRGLTDLADIYPDLFIAGRDLLERGEEEIHLLYGIEEEEELRGALLQVERKLLSIVEHGYGRLDEQIQKDIETMTIMSTLINSGEVFLHEAIDTFQSVVELKELSMRIEMDEILPAQLDAVEELIFNLESNYENSLLLIQDLTELVGSFDATFNSLFEAIDLVDSVVGLPRNPIYQNLVDRLLESVQGNKDFRRIQFSVEERVIDLLNEFEGVLPSQVSSKEISAQGKRKKKKKKKKKKCKRKKCKGSTLSGFLAILDSTKNSMISRITYYNDEAGKPLLNEQELSALMREINRIHDEIKGYEG